MSRSAGAPAPAAARPSVAVCVPVFNKRELTARFLASFAKVRYGNWRLVITDDGSTDGTADWLRHEHPDIVVLPGDGSLWWTGGTNAGVEYALREGFDFVLTINNDAVVDPDFLDRLVDTALAQPRSIVGSRLNVLQDPQRVWCLGGVMDWATGRILKLHETGETESAVTARHPAALPVPILTGCGTLIPSACFREIGLFDARDCPQYHADSELMLRAAGHGWQVLVEPRAVVWNDIVNTTRYTNRRDAIFSIRSFYYWRPMWAIHRRYCPRRFLLHSLWVQYRWLVPRPGWRHVRQLAGALAARARGR